MVVGKSVRKKTGEKRKWAIILFWHPKCWLRQAIDYAKKHQKTETRGRVPLPPEIRDTRIKILARHAAVVQRMRREMERPGPERNVDRILHLGSLLVKLEEEIELCGGKPNSWD